MVHLILCGGVGSRLWPLSRMQLPKQFARILSGDSFFEASIRRTRSLANKLFVASSSQQFFLAASQISSLGIDDWSALVEPVGRNTAPAIALCCMSLAPDEIVFVTPSDHIVRDDQAYLAAVKRATILAEQGRIVTFGIKPEYPETGYGYIEASGEQVLSFREKPDPETAKRYVDSGKYLWNSGMFCFKAGVLLSELASLSPEIFAPCQACYSRAKKGTKLEPHQDDMQKIPAVSIDYAVLEKSQLVSVVPCDIGWSDVGSYDSLRDCLKLDSPNIDSNNNISNSTEIPVYIDSTHNMVIGRRQVALIGVNNLMVVESPDALLIAARGTSQKVKDVFDELKRKGSDLVERFPRVERAWGSYEILQSEKLYRVVRVEILPGSCLSMHSHQGRQETWTVLEGKATITIDDKKSGFVAGQTATAPARVLHRIENNGEVNTVILEVQAGDFIADSDIERLEEIAE